MPYYFECFQIGAVALISLTVSLILAGLLMVNVIENYKTVLKWLGIVVGVVSAVALAEAVGMALKAIMKN